MTLSLSTNTQAILLLTAPLLSGGKDAAPAAAVLTAGEYRRFAKALWSRGRQPADLLDPREGDALLAATFDGHDAPELDGGPARIRALLGRGFLLAQVLDRWAARSIWVISRADADYPKLLKTRLRDDAPALLYGCGDRALLDHGGLAIVGSRGADADALAFTAQAARAAVRGGCQVVSGGARGVDSHAMRAALDAGGRTCGILADGLFKAAVSAEHREPLRQGRLALASPFDPAAGFHVGNAMQRNKSVYALSGAALVVESDFEKGGTWEGAREQLAKHRFVPVYVRAGTRSRGLAGLRKLGATDWVEPRDEAALRELLSRGPNGRPVTADAEAPGLFDAAGAETPAATTRSDEVAAGAIEPGAEPRERCTPSSATSVATAATVSSAEGAHPSKAVVASNAPADVLFAAVRELICAQLVHGPMKDSEIAASLAIAPAQAKAWLTRLVAEGAIEKRTRPAGYIARGESKRGG